VSQTCLTYPRNVWRVLDMFGILSRYLGRKVNVLKTLRQFIFVLKLQHLGDANLECLTQDHDFRPFLECYLLKVVERELCIPFFRCIFLSF
jgi:hypothetical protein